MATHGNGSPTGIYNANSNAHFSNLQRDWKTPLYSERIKPDITTKALSHKIHHLFTSWCLPSTIRSCEKGAPSKAGTSIAQDHGVFRKHIILHTVFVTWDAKHHLRWITAFQEKSWLSAWNDRICLSPATSRLGLHSARFGAKIKPRHRPFHMPEKHLSLFQQ